MSDTPEQPTAPDSSRPSRKQPTDESIKETFESIIIAFILAFVFRAYVVEAFVIPTGSMAPTLLGAHVPITCGQCGYHFEIGINISGGSPRESITLSRPQICPMCHNPIRLGKVLPSSGDRILVQKYMYSLFEPRRWDVVVFKAPHQPDINYIKRLVGLPNERIHIIEGNVYVQPMDETGNPAGEWRIARKTDPTVNPHAYTIQRTVWQPIYHSTYIPADASARRWSSPWQVESGTWTGVGPGQSPARSYHFSGSDMGRLRFDFRRALPTLLSLHPYNQPQGIGSNIPFEDMRVAAGFQPESANLAVELQTTGRIDETGEPAVLLARIAADGTASLGRLNDDGTFEPFSTAHVGPFLPGRTRDVELWFVDQELSLWVDGRLAMEPVRFDIPYEAIVERPILNDRPDVAITVQGCPVTLHRVEVDRDLYYTSSYTDYLRGTLYKENGGSLDRGPVELPADQFFCLGDNSPASHDGRGWESVDSWVAYDKFTTHPQPGVVPRRLMMGRAFFVYYPAPYGWSPEGVKIIPNFARMRFIH